MKKVLLDPSEFQAKRHDYHLGELLTEQSHPKTQNLSQLANDDLPQAYQLFKEVDLEALGVLAQNKAKIEELSQSLKRCFENQGRVFICGCGATGRLALTIERVWREVHKDQRKASSIVAFMAGGDLALVKSIESFEDRESYGARQLKELGFSETDLLICVTEGGETPFVIGACEKSLELSQNSPYFLYANPDQQLIKSAERSKRVIENTKIKKINLTHSPQALAGSTRLQASSVLMMAVGQGIACSLGVRVQELQNQLIEQVKILDTPALTGLTLLEQEAIESNLSVSYSGDAALLISLFTDTTERSPTFSLTPFEHDLERKKENSSLCYLWSETQSPQEAWKQILGRAPRTLEWPEVKELAGLERLLGHDFSLNGLEKRKPYFKGEMKLNVFKSGEKIVFLSSHEKVEMPLILSSSLFYQTLLEHLVVKICLNAHSTLLMGRLGRYEGNLMTYVRASNFKLIDRACRFATLLLKNKGHKEVDQQRLVELCFKYAQSEGPVVLKMVRAY